MKSKIKFLLVFLIFFGGIILSIWAQDSEKIDLTRGIDAEERVERIENLYMTAEYVQCLQLIDESIKLDEENEIEFYFYQLATIYVYKALVIYAFRDEGYQQRIKDFLLKAVEANINYEFEDYSIIPTYIVDIFVKVKKEYLDQFKKTTRRHSLGVYGSLTALPTSLDNPEYLKPGIHYSFNILDSLMMIVDVEIPATENIFNMIMGRSGLIWFPSFQIETISMGLGPMYALRLERDANTLHSISIEGYGEFIFRFGLGLAASIELIRFDLSFGPYPSNISNSGSVTVISTESLQLSFASLRIYIFWTF